MESGTYFVCVSHKGYSGCVCLIALRLLGANVRCQCSIGATDALLEFINRGQAGGFRTDRHRQSDMTTSPNILFECLSTTGC